MAPGASPAVEPVVGEPAAVADLGDRRLLLVADVHAGIEVGLRYERGVELDSRADETSAASGSVASSPKPTPIDW